MGSRNQLLAWKTMVQTGFRTSFMMPVKANVNWFPGHMIKGLRQIGNTLRQVDLLLEVHDARIPYSGRNENFEDTVSIRSKPHILVLNKKDLSFGNEPSRKKGDGSAEEHIRKHIMNTQPHISDVVFTNCKNAHCPGLKSIIPRAVRLISESDRYNRSNQPESSILVYGIPNVGKSSLINQLRGLNLKCGGRVAKVGANPGVTRSLQTRIRVHDNPIVYLLDTPGIAKPNIRNIDVALKLAACGTLNDDAVGLEIISDYVLFCLNKHLLFSYVNYMDLDQPEDNVTVMLAKSAVKKNWLVTRKDYETGRSRPFPDWSRTSNYFLQGFREGHFGPVNLDIPAASSG